MWYNFVFLFTLSHGRSNKKSYVIGKKKSSQLFLYGCIRFNVLLSTKKCILELCLWRLRSYLQAQTRVPSLIKFVTWIVTCSSHRIESRGKLRCGVSFFLIATMMRQITRFEWLWISATSARQMTWRSFVLTGWEFVSGSHGSVTSLNYRTVWLMNVTCVSKLLCQLSKSVGSWDIG